MRQIIAYSLLVLLIITATALIARWRHNRPERTYRRELGRRRGDHYKRLAEKEGEPD